MKIYKFEHEEGFEIVAAQNAKEAVIHYFTNYQDDIITDEMFAATKEGIKITKVQGGDLTKKHRIFDEEKNCHVDTSYQEMIGEYQGIGPDVLVSPNY